ncbi:MAG: fatty acid desaturase, partial [Bradymonadaceae bacterium]
IGEYIGPLQLIGMAAVYNVLLHGVGVGAGSLLLFWVLPSLLSTFQLFYFGTYRPHLEPSGGYPDEHRAESNTLPPILSLLTCYHFGYHRAHHHFPDVPWWQLPEARRRLDAPSNLDETER